MPQGTPRTGYLGIKSWLHEGTSWPVSPALSLHWRTPSSCTEWHFPVPSSSICLFGKEGLVEALGLHFLHPRASPPLQS